MVDCVVIGAGVVGLAIARKLALDGFETLIFEQHEQFGTETSSRNSEVIHAGIYYPSDSLKACLCVKGRELLYAYCMDHGIDYRRCGKLIVASREDQLPHLKAIAQAAERNEVDDLLFLGERDATEMEPALRCSGALLSPSTGIIDSHAFMLSLLGEAEQAGATLVYRSAVTSIALVNRKQRVWIGGDKAAFVDTRWVINAAGLNATQVARLVDGFPLSQVPAVHLAKGNYFTLAGRAPFSRLIYPIPEPGGLGVHMTLDLAGKARFGPDVEWVSNIDYAVDASRGECFYDRIREYWPAIPEGSLAPAYCGIRPKLSGPGEPAQDFRIDGPATHGVKGLINLFGIESPGLTAALAIAAHVADILQQEPT